jgi:hypothetical protein
VFIAHQSFLGGWFAAARKEGFGTEPDRAVAEAALEDEFMLRQ